MRLAPSRAQGSRGRAARPILGAAGASVNARAVVDSPATTLRRAIQELVTRRVRQRASGFAAGLREFMYGMTGHEFARHALATRASLESLFMVVCVGDMVGVPVMPPYYSLRLLPYVVPDIATWRRRVLRERQLTDEHDLIELHGV
jgi:hypothetical protein